MNLGILQTIQIFGDENEIGCHEIEMARKKIGSDRVQMDIMFLVHMTGERLQVCGLMLKVH